MCVCVVCFHCSEDSFKRLASGQLMSKKTSQGTRRVSGASWLRQSGKVRIQPGVGDPDKARIRLAPAGCFGRLQMSGMRYAGYESR